MYNLSINILQPIPIYSSKKIEINQSPYYNLQYLHSIHLELYSLEIHSNVVMIALHCDYFLVIDVLPQEHQ